MGFRMGKVGSNKGMGPGLEFRTRDQRRCFSRVASCPGHLWEEQVVHVVLFSVAEGVSGLAMTVDDLMCT